MCVRRIELKSVELGRERSMRLPFVREKSAGERRAELETETHGPSPRTMQHHLARFTPRHLLPLQELIQFPHSKLRSLLRHPHPLFILHRLDGEQDVERLLPSERRHVRAKVEPWQKRALPSWTEGGDLRDGDVGWDARVVDLLVEDGRGQSSADTSDAVQRTSSPRT